MEHTDESVVNDKPEQPAVAISDPGEMHRAEHTSGDRFIVRVSNFFAWFFPILMAVIVLQVFFRNFGRLGIGPGNQAWLDDLQWWLYGSVVLIGIAYAVTTNSHVRVDIRYDNFDEKKKARTDVFALSWLFLPFVLMSWDMTFHYAYASVLADEGSSSPNGLHNLWILKVFMNAAFAFIALATWFMYVRRLSVLCEPVLWKKLLYALPSTWFAINLIVFYALWWITWLGMEDDANPRSVLRADRFDEIEWGPYETAPSVLYAGIITIVLILALRVLANRSGQEG